MLELLRGRRMPTPAQVLADELQVSVRTVYRNIVALQAEGLPIRAIPQAGYLLDPQGFLRPAPFSALEAEAVHLGLRLIEERGSTPLREAARSAHRKMVDSSHAMEMASRHASFTVAPDSGHAQIIDVLHDAMTRELRVEVTYRDALGNSTVRILWPIVVGMFQDCQMLAAHCELRNAFRHFRISRMVAVTVTEQRLPKPRRVLLAEWQRENRITHD
ncbi:helix-turn-helix transcriptional regulator [Massilia violaceinigra]|uniref:helix-turn-helix transcriptional regulator n=1 Tax=Massilia violaceinigra TaxID=2045208 RepID=UPI00142E1CB6|nr:WYL domain-containing protein [Massilia violaceinigra]